MKIISSFSGGKTSAYMTIRLKEKYGDDLVVLFANTSQENDETLSFVHKCDVEFKLNVVWLESVTYFHQKKASGYSVVDFSTACRDGMVYENMIKKYGIPNKSWPHCTRELKLNPIKSWIKDNIKGNYKMAIGIRADESKRVSSAAEKNHLFYPLVDEKINKIDINDFWENQLFNLNLHDYQGNCKWCFKKSNKKISMLIKENPEWFEFTDRMERLYPYSGANLDGNKRVFFRQKMSTQDLLFANDISYSDLEKFKSFIDDDENSGCSESCEAFT
jgi:hypothetical protein